MPQLKNKTTLRKIPDYSEDYYNGLPGIYFNSVIGKVIDFGKLRREKGIVLDFGCGTGNLKKRLRESEVRVVGYDILPENSDIRDYKKVRPSVIVCNHVLEHLTGAEIEEVIPYFLKTKARLVVALPTENFISKIGMVMAGNMTYHNDHKTKYRQVNRIMEKYYSIKKRAYVFTMTQVTLYCPKEI